MPAQHSTKSAALLFAMLLVPAYVSAQSDTPATEPVAETEATGSKVINEADQIATSSAAPVSAGNYTCALNGLVRRVEIAYENNELKVPCAVNYYKDSESPNEMSTLWSAQNMAGYCEEKASEFVEKLQSWGWSCNLN